MRPRRLVPLLLAPLLLFAAVPGRAAPEETTVVLDEDVLDVALDGNGDRYVVGFLNGENWDAYVAKVSPSGTVLWTRTLGGFLNDVATGVAVDPSGNVYVAGETHSPDFPRTEGAWRTEREGDSDGWAAKFDPEGDLVYSTLVGGGSGDRVTDIDWAPSGQLAILGRTFSCDFPVTSGAFDRTCAEGGDAFVVKLASNGRSAVFATYLGGSGEEYPSGIAVSRSSGTVMVAGSTASTDFPTTSGAMQRTHRGGELDGFVTKLSSSGSSLSFSTLLGGSDVDLVEGLARDSGGDAFVTGITWSPDLPTTSGAFQTSFGGGLECSFRSVPDGAWIEEACADAFVARIVDGGTGLRYLSYLGSEGVDEGYDVAIDTNGAAYVTGATNSTDFPLIDARVTRDDADHAMFAASFAWNGRGLLYSEVLPVERTPYAVAVTFDGQSHHGGVGFGPENAGYLTRIGVPTPGIVVSPRGGNEFWVETFVGGTRAGSVVKVEARDNDTDWTTLPKTEWGFFAGSVHVEDDHVVEFRVTLEDATATTSGCYHWPDAAPAPCFEVPEPTVSFTHGGGNEWWVEAKIDPKPARAQAMDTGGEWKELSFKSWGEWAASFHIEPGHRVTFRAIYPDGTTVESCSFSHPAGIAGDEDGGRTCVGGGGGDPDPDPEPSDFDATFRNVRGNEWWIETDVSVTGGTLAGVDARVDGGAWIALEKKSWGSWAKSIHAPEGSTVEFRARATDGSTDTSAVFEWPPG